MAIKTQILKMRVGKFVIVVMWIFIPIKKQKSIVRLLATTKQEPKTKLKHKIQNLLPKKLHKQNCVKAAVKFLQAQLLLTKSLVQTLANWLTENQKQHTQIVQTAEQNLNFLNRKKDCFVLINVIWTMAAHGVREWRRKVQS